MVKTAFLTALLLGVSLVVSFALIGCEGCYQEERFHDQQTETAIAAKAQETPVPTGNTHAQAPYLNQKKRVAL